VHWLELNLESTTCFLFDISLPRRFFLQSDFVHHVGHGASRIILPHRGETQGQRQLGEFDPTAQIGSHPLPFRMTLTILIVHISPSVSDILPALEFKRQKRRRFLCIKLFDIGSQSSQKADEILIGTVADIEPDDFWRRA